MPTSRIRKCRSYGQIELMDHKTERECRLEILEELGDWVADWVRRDWDAYLVTVMFHNLAGPRNSQIAQMHQEVTKLFSKLVTRMVRKPRSPAWVPLLPKGIFVPDLPVVKRTRTPLKDVVTNDGLHMHGIIVANRWGRN